MAQDESTNADEVYNKGAALFYSGDYNGSISFYDKALAIDPVYEDALFNKGLALDNLGNYSEAIKYYDKVLAVNPGYPDAMAFKKDAMVALSSSE